MVGSITFKGPSVAIEDGTEAQAKPNRKPASLPASPVVREFSPVPKTPSYEFEASGDRTSNLSYQPQFDDENFEADESFGAHSSESETVSSAAPIYPKRKKRGPSSSSNSYKKKNSDSDSSDLSTPSSHGYVGGGNWYQAGSGEIITNSDDTIDDDDDDDSSCSSCGSSSSPTLSCSSNYGTGGYSDIVSVELSCTSSASIKYCVSENTCCDPRISGLSYTGIIPIGVREGSYCLSFYGTSSSLTSTIVQHTYTVDKLLPDLNVSHLLTHYQTTELPGSSSIESNDFGKMNFDVGQINLLTHDPGPSGLNLNCEDLLLSFESLTSPVPRDLSIMDASALSPSASLNLPLDLNELAYGDNYVLSFMSDHSSTLSLYSCSTTKVRLFDFEYFEAGVNHGDVGTDYVREFEGGFSAYGFFEASDVYRGPAGESAESKGGQKLETGLFSIFY